MRVVLSLAESSGGTWGGLARFRVIASALTARGHEVAFLVPPSLGAPLGRAGYRVCPTPPGTFFGLPRPLSDRLTARRSDAVPPVRQGRDFGSIWLVTRIEGFANRRYLSTLVDAELRYVAELRPDVLVSNLDLGLFLVGHATGIPVATMYASIKRAGRGTFSWRRVARAVDHVTSRLRLPSIDPDELCYGPRVLKIVPSVPELEDLDAGAGDVRFVGGLLPEPEAGAPFVPEPGARYVFAYLGTGAVPFAVVRRVLPELMRRFPEHVCVVSSQAVTAPWSEGNVRFTGWVPADALLPYCDATICHGGLNTIIGSLAHGVPVIAFPGPIFERRFNARAVQRRGAGVMGERRDFTPEWLSAALSGCARYRPAAVELGRVLRSYDGAQLVVAALAEHAGVDR